VQRWLFVAVKDLFPDLVIHEEYLHPLLIGSGAQRLLQLDVYIPGLRLAFEFHGVAHYRDEIAHFRASHHIAKNDAHKRLACKNANITLIEVPYWWDKQKTSLAGTIAKYRPDLISTTIDADFPPIPSDSPSSSKSRKFQFLDSDQVELHRDEEEYMY